MAYNFTDRLTEWTTWAGAAVAAAAAAVPHLIPATDNHWVAGWQVAQTILGTALMFVPQTAGSKTVERDAWTLLTAFANELPPEYRTQVQPMLGVLAGMVATVNTSVPATPAPAVPATPPATA